MKLTRANVCKVRRESESELTKRVCNYILNNWSDYSDKCDIFKDVLYHGCQSGVVGELIYYSDTVAFYKEYQDEINELLYETTSGTGIYAMKDLFGDRFDEEDPLCIEVYNQNLLAWFGFEETLRNIGLMFTELEDYI